MSSTACITHSCRAYAKINLALHVTGRRYDGLHLLDSLVCFADIGDHIKISLSSNFPRLITLKSTGPFAHNLCAPQDNLIVRAACALANQLNESNISCLPVCVSLVKDLPVASGIGGASSNAAAALMLLTGVWAEHRGINSHKVVDLYKIAAGLGADIPMCLDYRPKRAQGVGEKLSPFRLSCSLPLLLINSGASLPTPDVFGVLEKKNYPSIDMAGMGDITSIDEAVTMLSPLRNDLHAPAIRLMPVIEDVLTQIGRQQGCLLARMSGSGATCFGIFDSEKHAGEAMALVKEKNPDWWVIACRTMSIMQD